MSHRVTHTLARVAPVLPAAVALVATPAGAQDKIPDKAAEKALVEKHLAKFKKPPHIARIFSLELTPAVAKAGDTVTVKLTAENQTDAKLALDYEIKLPGGTTKTGKIPLAAKGKGSVSTTFTAGTSTSQRVTAVIDPKNVLKEPTAQRNDNAVERDLAVTTGSSAEWNGWAQKGAERVFEMLQAEKSKICIRKGTINGSLLDIDGLSMTGPGPGPHKLALKNGGMPDVVAKAFMEGSYKSLSEWARNYKGKHPGAFPQFVAWPLGQAPAQPGVFAPMGIGASVAGTQAISPQGIEQFVLAQLGSRKNEPGAADAVRTFSIGASSTIAYWLVTNYLRPWGGGPVPSWAPPYVPVGPVVMGQTDPTLACML